jgi:hypothetical protein
VVDSFGVVAGNDIKVGDAGRLDEFGAWIHEWLYFTVQRFDKALGTRAGLTNANDCTRIVDGFTATRDGPGNLNRGEDVFLVARICA